MIIRPFSSAESQEVRSMVLEVLAGEGFQYDPLKDSDLEDIKAFYLDTGGAFFVALDEGIVVGSSAVRKVSSDIGEIKRIYVRKDFRCKGVGTALLLEALKFAEKNFSLGTLKTDVSLDTAIRIYLKNGFSITKQDSETIYFEKNLR